MKIAVLASGKGSNFVALQQAIRRGELAAEIVTVISDCEDAGVFQKAEHYGIPTTYVSGTTNFSAQVAQKLKKLDVELVCLAGLMRIVREPLLEAFPNRIINIHPSLLPNYPGKEAWKQALEDGATETGCTVHFVDAGLDTGKVILQKRVAVLKNETPESLHSRIQEAEHLTYVEALQILLKRSSGHDRT